MNQPIRPAYELIFSVTLTVTAIVLLYFVYTAGQLNASNPDDPITVKQIEVFDGGQ